MRGASHEFSMCAANGFVTFLKRVPSLETVSFKTESTEVISNILHHVPLSMRAPRLALMRVWPSAASGTVRSTRPPRRCVSTWTMHSSL